ncbi:solute carrier family 41 member 1-like isoform X2 [Dermacentor andersoni]|uniref:solute carrier family 41 member 1-like isoform X2 n=1 Tax=Dermacentor andersoni TaxID=34620 RepID=UPI002155B8A5|nr:solute carrier family 41 member 1-like isoform X2 [Dermacentor andersoni]XP_054922341.1 solute carrier family 41 member 1-like isoform X2 [Dermacentor andersoni]
MGSVSPTGHALPHSRKGLRHRMVPRLTGDKAAKESHPLNDLASSTPAHRSDVESGGEGDWTADEEVTVVDKEPLLPRRLSADGVKGDRAGTTTSDTPEALWSVAVQVFVPFLIAGFGTVGAGLVLDVIQHWKVFQKVSELFILVPALLGLKGNLEMTLASRLSTQANLGKMDTSAEQWRMATGNLALLQCQATVVGFLASLFAMVIGWIPEGAFSWRHALLLCASSLLTASVASLVLGLVMIGVVIASRKCHVNPDNVATPIAASLGDLTTLALLALVASFLYACLEVHRMWLVVVVLVAVALLLPLWGILACANPHTQEVLYTGWTPVISAMVISSVGGCILDFAVSRFHGIAVFQPVINGVGGNLVAVQASRISTFLHQRATLGFLPASDPSVCLNPFTAFFGKSVHARTARVLLLMVVPGHLVFTYGIRLLKAGHTSVTPIFLVVYLTAAVLQVLLLLYMAHVMVHWMWSRAVDPDNSAIPYLTALGDLAGTALLALSFLLLDAIGDGDVLP